LILKLEKQGITKENYTNKSIQETVSNSLEKEKIEIDSLNYKFIPIIDPIFRIPMKIHYLD